jgi:hypothetical protein
MVKKFDNAAWDAHWKPAKASCYASHPPLKFTALDGKEYELYGGNCSTPTVHDADVYIGFTGMNVSNGNPRFPWEKGYVPVTVVDYPVTDMSTPKDPKSFHALVDWSCNQLREGKKIHGGCHGGHGRTGMWLAAVYAQMTGNKDAIQFVRKNYCTKAVETDEQITFLMQEFGINTAPAGKKFLPLVDNGKGGAGGWGNYKSNGYQGSSGGTSKVIPASFSSATRHFAAVESSKNIW